MSEWNPRVRLEGPDAPYVPLVLGQWYRITGMLGPYFHQGEPIRHTRAQYLGIHALAPQRGRAGDYAMFRLPDNRNLLVWARDLIEQRGLRFAPEGAGDIIDVPRGT